MPEFPDDSFPYAVTEADIQNARKATAPPTKTSQYLWSIGVVLLVVLFVCLRFANMPPHAEPAAQPQPAPKPFDLETVIAFAVCAIAIASAFVGIVGSRLTQRAYPQHYRKSPKDAERFEFSPQGLILRWPHRSLFIPWQRFNALHETEDLFILTSTQSPEAAHIVPLRDVPPHRIDSFRRLIQSEIEKGKP